MGILGVDHFDQHLNPNLWTPMFAANALLNVVGESYCSAGLISSSQ